MYDSSMDSLKWVCPVCYATNAPSNVVCSNCKFDPFPYFSNASYWTEFRTKVNKLEESVKRAEHFEVDKFNKSPSVNDELPFFIKYQIAQEAEKKIYALLKRCLPYEYLFC